MNTRAATTAVLLALAMAAGCSADEPPQDKEAARELGRDTDDTVFDDMIQTQDRARGVEQTTMDAKAATDAAIDAQTGDAAEDPDQ
jgi:hypothetical protein